MIPLPESPLERAKRKYRPLQSVDDLIGLERLPAYPKSAGWKRTDTSRSAAQSTDAAGLRGKVLGALAIRSMTADECAAALRCPILSIRPRLSELRELGRVEDSGERRRNASGKNAIVWRLILERLAA